MKTRITELFGIQYPIIQGAMQWLSKPRLAAAVSNAGGLGTINMTTYATPEDFQAAIQELKSLTDRPFSVNLSLLPDTKPDGPIKGFLQAVVEEKVKIVQEADAIYREEIAKAGLDQDLNQYFAALTNMRSVGVMGDERTYDYAVALRAVRTVDFMTAEAAEIPYEVLNKVMSRIINEVRGVNRVFYDLTSKND